MKKFAYAVLVGILGFLFVGCDKPTDQQCLVISKQAGTVAVVTWFGIDNPDKEIKDCVKEVVTLIQSKAKDVTAGQSFSVTLTPVVDEYIKSKVADQYKPLTTVGSSMILSGLDLLFAMHPEYSQNQTFALQLVSEFCGGAILGLSLDEADKIIQITKSQNKARSIALTQSVVIK